MWYCNEDGQKAATMAQDRLNVIRDEESEISGVKTTVIDVPATENEIQKEISEAVQGKDESIHDFICRTCVWCARRRLIGGEDRTILEFIIRSPGIWLHALQYSIPFSTDSEEATKDVNAYNTFRAPLPTWHEV